jgi:hypothetical protein
MRYKIIVYVILGVLIALVFSRCATHTPTSFYSDISESAYKKITQQKNFDDGWWQQGAIYFHDGRVWYGEICRMNEMPLIKFKRDTIKQVFSHVQLKGYVYTAEKEDHTFVFKDVNPNPNINEIEILEVLQYGDINLYRSWFVKSEGNASLTWGAEYWLISTLYLQHQDRLIPWKSFEKDVLPLIEPNVYQNYVDIWGDKSIKNINHQMNIIRDHNQNKLKKS